ncbi:MAG: DUF4167 domain-containing protein [Sphingomonadaceae bacterium]
MQNRQNGRRRRGGGNNPRPMGQPMGGQGNSSRLEVKVRGNAHQLLEKYKVLARDAHQAGDRVASEYYLQHADHYFRVLNDTRLRQDEMRARRNIFDPLADDDDDGDTMSETSARPRDEQFSDREPPRARRDAPARPPQDEQQRTRRWRDEQPEAPRAEAEQHEPVVLNLWDAEEDSETPVAEPEDSEAAPTSDGEAALVAFGGKPARTRARTRTRTRTTSPDLDGEASDVPVAAAEVTAAPESIADETPVTARPATRTTRKVAAKPVSEAADSESESGEKPAPRRRGRPRKTETVSAGD